MILWAALTLTSSAAFAQNDANRDRLDNIEKMDVQAKRHRYHDTDFRKAGAEMYPEVGAGVHFVSSNDFRSRALGSGQVYVHILDAYVRPVSWMSLHVGGGIGVDRFMTRTSAFLLDDNGNILVRDLVDTEKNAKKFRSSISEGTIMLPASLRFHAGYATIRLGAEALYAFGPNVRYDHYTEDLRQLTDNKGARITPWSYDFVASLTFSGLGLYVKYQPASARRFPEPGPAFSTWTVGLCLITF